VTFLRSKGFYVPAQARSNYLMTEESLSSSLNMTYLDFFSKNPGENSHDKRSELKFMRENRVAKSLKSIGYSYTLFRSDWFAWRGETFADRIPVTSGTLNNDFLVQLIGTTMLRSYSKPIITIASVTNKDREIFHRQLAEIPKAASHTKGPHFVFAYMVPPHPPFIFNKDGDVPTTYVNSLWSDKKLVKRAYLEQFIYVTKQIKKLVNSLLSGNGRKPVIIIQSDHGPRSFVVGSGESDKTALQKINRSFAILNAYYCPLPESGTAKGSCSTCISMLIAKGCRINPSAAQWSIRSSLKTLRPRSES
jgi:hypothetical protein